MRRLAALLTGFVGGLTAFKWLSARAGKTGEQAAPSPVSEPPDPRAETLRRRLAEARAAVGGDDELDGAEVTVDRAEPAPPGPDERRRRVHAEARAAAEALRRSDAGDR